MTASPAPDDALLCIRDFVFELELHGLGSYLRRRLPDVGSIVATVRAMEQHFPLLAGLLSEVASLFLHYRSPRRAMSWEQELAAYDPKARLPLIERELKRDLLLEAPWRFARPVP